ncbi:MAG: MBL fold metallo-hydrolase [Magnetococcales bacterium]|nr:MBL fold metallo-hydrolase [Magnetococcales bacterium]
MAHIRKIKVANGIFWVEIQEIDFRLLCGCPADSVKHLLKRGLIMPVEQDGVTYESGPNAILLSDVLIQNGDLCNLAEFPVLQMLYRQGMILPGHPNNTGRKPLLIGSTGQVAAQMDYIYRGNYGLTNEKEILEAGIGPDEAKRMMALKLQFAFGSIRPSEELLDVRVIHSTDPTTIVDGVEMQRLALNHFALRYQGEEIEIDLNLESNASYALPYPLSYHKTPREYFGIIHAGEGDGWDINRPTMSSILMFQGKIYLIDAGPNLHYSLTALGIDINEIEGIFHTHAHDDHFCGITTLIRAGHRIKYYATPLVRASVTKKLSALLSLEEGFFDHYFEVHDLTFDQWNDMDGLEVKPIFSPHPVETNIYLFRTLWEDGYRSYAHYADIVALDVLQRMVDPKANGPCDISQDYFNRVRDEYLIPADIKKIDIGGGMIHGVAKDFTEDQSKKIILSHTSLKLTAREKEVGSSSPFGTIDVLIPNHTDHVRRIAFKFLHAYFMSIPEHLLNIVLNNPVVHFSPGSILLKKGQVNQDIYLIITGSVEVIWPDQEMASTLPSGALIGEYDGLLTLKSRGTYHAVSYVQALRIPCSLYSAFIKRNKLFSKVERVHTNHQFLQQTWLFQEEISYATQNRIAIAMERLTYPKTGTKLIVDDECALYLVISGELSRMHKGKELERLKPKSFYGEEDMIDKPHTRCHFRTLGEVELYKIPCTILKDIPIVRWKLFEMHAKRVRMGAV